jgi:hypothetical protein
LLEEAPLAGASLRTGKYESMKKPLQLLTIVLCLRTLALAMSFRGAP